MTRTVAAIVSVAACVLLWVVGISAGYAPQSHYAVQRTSVPEGRIDVTSEPFLQSGFVLDRIIDGAFSDTIFSHPESGLSRFANLRWRAYAPGPMKLIVNFANRASTRNSPFVWLYDETGQLIGSSSDNSSRHDPVLHELELPGNGFYSVKIRFHYEDVAAVTIAGEAPAEPRVSFQSHHAATRKQLDISILPSELDRLWRMVEEARSVWLKAPPGDVLWPQYRGITGRVYGSIRSRNGDEARVAIGLAGRSYVHLPRDGSLPSLDIKVLAGPLPYGLKRFRIYADHSKELSEVVHTSILEDFGTLGARQDRVAVGLNGKPVGEMHLLEGPDAHFFEYAQQVEGPIFGYDPDETSGYFYKNKFQVKNFASKKTDGAIATPDLSSPQFISQLDQFKILLAQSYGLTFAAYHGLGQGDMRYHWNFRSATFDPIVKDLDAGVLAPRPGAFTHWWAYIAPLAASWRPNAVTIASYYLKHSESARNIYTPDGSAMLLWHTPPSTLEILDDAANLETLTALLEMWASDWSRARVDTRLRNASVAAEQPLPERTTITQDYLTEDLWSPLGRNASEGVMRLGTMIRALTDGELVPEQFKLAVLQWRIDVLKHANPVVDDPEMVESPTLTFLYRDENPDWSDIVLIERNPGDSALDVTLQRDTGGALAPRNVYDSGGEIILISARAVDMVEVAPEERVRLYWFRVDRSLGYTYLSPKISGPGIVLLPREIVVSPAYPKFEQAGTPSGLHAALAPSGFRLQLKDTKLVVDDVMVVPRGRELVIERDTEIAFGPEGCLVVYGDLMVTGKARLSLKPSHADRGWNGVHFFGGTRTIRNLDVEGIGHGGYSLTCGGRVYTGGVSVYDSNGEILDSTIRFTNVEDALHLVGSEYDIRNVTFDGAQSDCIDADFSVLRAKSVSFSNCRGDAIDVSGAQLFVVGIDVWKTGDKGISVGENSRAYIADSSFRNSDIGVASKDGSIVDIRTSLFKDNRHAVAVFSKKPYFPMPTIAIDADVIFEGNLIRVARQ